MERQIWNYPATTAAHSVLRAAYEQRLCPCCHRRHLISEEGNNKGDGRFHTEHDGVSACHTCGWWLGYHYFCRNDDCHSMSPEEAELRITASGAALERYADFDDKSTLALLQREVEDHVRRHGASRSWAVMEDATAAILRAFGYQARATARSKDDGVDIVVESGAGSSVFVQVKHTRNKVDVEVFRELVGTMWLNGVHAGMLVTSSHFTGPTRLLADRAAARGMLIELVDGERFLAALNLCARLRPPTLGEISAVARPTTVLRDERILI